MLRSAARIVKITLTVATLAVSLPLTLEAQAVSSADAALAAIRSNWRSMTTNITRSAEMMPEADYAYRPVGTVRTFGEVIGHVAGAQFSICAAALGDKPRAEDAVEKNATTKAALVQAMKESTFYCEKAYAQNPVALAGMTELFGDQSTRYGAIALNGVHNAEHYGNIVTYLRMKGMVPPSSQR
ncbi:MAG: DinB family protein [Gemmatimonas sp.]